MLMVTDAVPVFPAASFAVATIVTAPADANDTGDVTANPPAVKPELVTPTLSVADIVSVTICPVWNVAPLAGDVIVTVGFVVSGAAVVVNEKSPDVLSRFELFLDLTRK